MSHLGNLPSAPEEQPGSREDHWGRAGPPKWLSSVLPGDGSSAMVSAAGDHRNRILDDVSMVSQVAMVL